MVALPVAGVTFAAVGAATLGSGQFTEQDTDVGGVHVPWLAIGLLTVGIPLATAGMAWLAAASVSGRRPRDLSTLALAAD